MDIDKSQSSFYDRFLAAFLRKPNGTLIHCFGPSRQDVASLWDHIQPRLHLFDNAAPNPSPASSTTVRVDLEVPLAKTNENLPILPKAVIFESLGMNGETIIGIILQDDSNSNTTLITDSVYATLVIKGIRLDIEADDDTGHCVTTPNTIADAIVDHFSFCLRYAAENDQWNHGGRQYFLDRVRHFTDRGKRVEFCLPAFPCKSSNLDKVQGTLPDLGERIALANLHRFVEGIEKIYKPGARLWIISDGHVFSDCIGVDDDAVDLYADRLSSMNENLYRGKVGANRVCFKSLVDLFDLGSSPARSNSLIPKLYIPQILHQLQTQLSPEAELSRRMLMLGFQGNEGELRERINSKDPAILSLYRGFSKFMLEDLELNPYTTDLSRSQRRKLSSKVAFEMILRNQAYSNLVEMLFPQHIRLSIHAHPNSGPKFGIQMFGPNVRATNVLLSDRSLMVSDDLLHVPTPWHNCVVEIEGHSTLYVTKSSIVREAVSSGKFKVIQGRRSGEEEDHFHLMTTLSSFESDDQNPVNVVREVELPTNRLSTSRKSSIALGARLAWKVLESLWNFTQRKVMPRLSGRKRMASECQKFRK